MHGSRLHDDSWASRLHGATLNEAARNTGRGTQTHSESNQQLHVRSYLSLCKFAFLVIWKFHFTESSISCSVSACFLSFMKGGITTSILCARACVHEHVCQQCNSSQQHMKAEKSSLVFRATLFFLLLWRWNESRVRQFKRNKPQSTVVSVCIIVTRGIRLVLSLPLSLRSLNNWQMGSLPFEVRSFWSLRIIKRNSSCITFRVPLTCAFPTFLKSQ